MPRPKTPLLSSQRILDSALAVIDEVGTDKFSIHRVARELGVKPPSIYYYFADRDVLIASVCLRVLQDVHVPKKRDSEWGQRLVRDAIAYYRALCQHPNLASTLLLERKTRAGAAERFEDALLQMKDAGIAPADGLAIIDGIEGIALSWIAFQHAPAVAIDPHRYPALTAASGRQKFDEASYKRTISALIAGARLMYAGPNAKGRSASSGVA